MGIKLQLIPLSNFSKIGREHALWQAEQIFFETATQKNFRSPEDRQNFRKRWFDRYAELYPSEFLLALVADQSIIAYLAGCLSTNAVESRELVEDMGYYAQLPTAVIRDYPSHLHINVKPGQQRQGLGKALIKRFAEACRTSGSSGIHVVTGQDSPAVAFYEACGFKRERSEMHEPKLSLLTLPL